MNTQAPPSSRGVPPPGFSIIRATLRITWRALAVVVLADYFLNLVMHQLHGPLGHWWDLLDGLVLAIVALPLLYRACLYPVARVTAEREAAAAEERFRVIARAMHDGVIMFDSQGRIRFANQSAERMHGYAPGELQGASMEMLMPEPVRKMFLEALPTRMLRGEGPLIGRGLTEICGVRRSGEEFPVEVVLDELPSDRELCFVAILRDVTQRKKAEALLKESEAMFREVADTAPVMLWMGSPEGKCTFVNQGWLEFSGRRPEEELGTGWTERIHPEDRQRAYQVARAAHSNRQEFSAEYRMLRAQGDYRWVFVRGRPRFLPDGTYSGYIGSCFDISERKQAEEALQASEHKFRELLEKLPAPVRIVQNERLVFANPADAELHGYESVAQEICTAGAYRQIAPDEVARMREYARKRAAGDDAPRRYEVKRRRSDGSEFPAEVRAERILFEGAPASLLVVQDLSERRRLKMLEKILPMCCMCGKIRDDGGTEAGRGPWERLDHYVARHSDAQISHTFCPGCMEEYRQREGLPRKDPDNRR